MRNRDMRDKTKEQEAGSGTVYALAVILVVLIIGGLVVATAMMYAVKTKARAGIDMAALAAADAMLSGRGDECARGQTIASRNQIALTKCVSDGNDVWLTGARTFEVLGQTVPITVRAKAGLPAQTGFQ